MTPPIVLVLPYPVSGNAYWASRIVTSKQTKRAMALYYRTHEADAFIKVCQQVAVAANIVEPLTGRLELAYRLYPQRPQDWATRQRKLGDLWDDDVRCVDLYNAEKVMADALQGIVYANDKQVWKAAAERMEPDAYGARLVVYVRKIPRRSPQQELIG